jgi:CsoR family transcriptional regulator, copper-sensing transcriptional repressor
MKSEHNQKLVKRLKIIEGQIRGLQEMVDNRKYCIDIITQTSAVKQALSGIEDALMESHLNHCILDQVKKGNEKKATNEIMKVYKLKRK